jgi:hypothetical protein
MKKSLGGLIEKNCSDGDQPYPEIFRGHIQCQSKKSNSFSMLTETKNSNGQPYQIRVKESNDDVISGLAHPLAAEIVISSVSALGKASIISKWYKIDGKDR